MKSIVSYREYIVIKKSKKMLPHQESNLESSGSNLEVVT